MDPWETGPTCDAFSLGGTLASPARRRMVREAIPNASPPLARGPHGILPRASGARQALFEAECARERAACCGGV
jgi:hypothetical protein